MQEGLQVLDILCVLERVGLVEHDVQRVWANHQPCNEDREQTEWSERSQQDQRAAIGGFVSNYSRMGNILHPANELRC